MARKTNITIPNINQLNLEVKLNGDWYKLDRLADNLVPSVMGGYDTGVNKFSRRLLVLIKKCIRTGTPPPGVNWEPLSPATIKRWGDHEIYYLTGLYFRSVGLFRYKSRTLIGLPIAAKRSSARGLTLNQLAIILEFGTGGMGGGRTSGTIPGRPLWAPSFKSLGGTNKLKKTIIMEIRRRLYKDLGIRANQVRVK